MKLAFVFPGQGSQSVGMMRAFTDSAEVRAVFDEASSALGQDLWTLVEQGPKLFEEDLPPSIPLEPRPTHVPCLSQ